MLLFLLARAALANEPFEVEPVTIEQAREAADRQAAIDAHGKAKKSRLPADWEAADAAYQAWFTKWPASPYAYDMHYAYAELLYAMKRFDGAYDEYMKVVAIDPAGSHSKFCAESAIFAADELVHQALETRGASRGPTQTTPVPLTPEEQRSLDACDTYLRLYPTDPKAGKIGYKAAYLLFSENHFPEAAERFQKVIAPNPKAKEAEQAANLVLDSLVLTQDWARVAATADAFLAIPDLGTPEFKAEVAEVAKQAKAKMK